MALHYDSGREKKVVVLLSMKVFTKNEFTSNVSFLFSMFSKMTTGTLEAFWRLSKIIVFFLPVSQIDRGIRCTWTKIQNSES